MLVGIVEGIRLHLSEIFACKFSPTEPVAQNEAAADGFEPSTALTLRPGNLEPPREAPQPEHSQLCLLQQ